MKKFLLLLFLLCAIIAQNNIDELRKRLQSRNYLEKSQALQETIFMYEKAAPLLPELLKMLETEKGQNKYFVVQTLANMENYAKDAVPLLSKIVLESDDFSLRYACIIALGQIKDSSALQCLQQIMMDEDPNIRSAVVFAFAQIAPTNFMELLEKFAQDPDIVVRKTLIIQFQMKAFDVHVSKIIQPSLEYPDEEIRLMAIQVMQIIPENAKEIIPIYQKQLYTKNPQIALQIINDFAAAGKISQDAIPDILKFLSDKNLSAYASTALIKIGDSSIPYLETCLKSTDELQRQQAIYIIYKLNKAGDYSSLFVTMSIEDKSELVRRACLVALEQKEISAASVEYLKQQLPDKTEYCLDTIGTLKLTLFVPELRNIIDTKSQNLRRKAYTAIGKIATADASVIDILIKGLGDNDEEIVKISLKSLGEIQEKATPAIAELKKMLHQNNPFYTIAIAVVGRIGVSARECLPEITEIFQTNPDRLIKYSCMNTMIQMEDHAIPFFLECLDSVNFHVRYYSVMGISHASDIDLVLPRLKEFILKEQNATIKQKAVMIYNSLAKKSVHKE